VKRLKTLLAVMALGLMLAVALAIPAMAADKPKEVQRSPIATFKDGFTLEQSKQFLAERNIKSWLEGGDVSTWAILNFSQLLPTAVVPNRQPARELPKAIIPAIGEIKVETRHFGSLALDEFMSNPKAYAQGFIVVHKGRIVYENYPAILPTDDHAWMSCAKVLPSLVIDLLISDGKIDENKTIGVYVPAFRGTAWENIKVRDVMDMTPGLDTEENDETRSDPNSIAIRVFEAEFNMPHNGKQEVLLDVLKDAKKVAEPGTKFEYGSPTTQVLVYLAEAVTGERWEQFVDKRIWSKLGAEGPLLVHTTPDGVAIAHGVVSSRLRDMARFGMLYTPSWKKVASEQVVTLEILERIRKSVRSREFYRNGFDGPHFVSRLNDDTMISNSRQWDAVWPDLCLSVSGSGDRILFDKWL